MKRGKRKGQSTLEYMIIFLVVVAAIAAFAWNALNPSVSNLLNKAADKINSSADEFAEVANNSST